VAEAGRGVFNLPQLVGERCAGASPSTHMRFARGRVLAKANRLAARKRLRWKSLDDLALRFALARQASRACWGAFPGIEQLKPAITYAGRGARPTDSTASPGPGYRRGLGRNAQIGVNAR